MLTRYVDYEYLYDYKDGESLKNKATWKLRALIEAETNFNTIIRVHHDTTTQVFAIQKDKVKEFQEELIIENIHCVDNLDDDGNDWYCFYIDFKEELEQSVGQYGNRNALERQVRII